MRRVALMLVAASIVSIGVFAGPAHAAKKITSCQKDKKLNQNITTAFNGFLQATTVPDKVKYIQSGDKLTSIIQEGQAANPNPTSKTWAVALAAKCDGKKAATFSYDLGITDAAATTPPTKGLGLSFTGDAVLDKKSGKWLVSGATVCDLTGQNPATPGIGPRCLAALGG